MEKRILGGRRQRPSHSGTAVAHRGSLPADGTRVRFASNPVRGRGVRCASALFPDSDQGEVCVRHSGSLPADGTRVRCASNPVRGRAGVRCASALFPDSDQGEVCVRHSGSLPADGTRVRFASNPVRGRARVRFACALFPDSHQGEVCVRHSRESGLGRRACPPAVIRPWSLETTVNTRRHYVPFTV